MPEIIPIFPLHVVLYPGGILPLKIFEARYLDMVSDCLRNDSGFGVCLIREGNETGQAATTEEVGTYARIRDWDRSPDGLLGISIVGEQRFQLIKPDIQADNLVRGEITWIDNECPCEVPPESRKLQELMSQLIRQYDLPNDPSKRDLEDAVWLGYRLAEVLPLDLNNKQALLELTDPVERLDRIKKWVDVTELKTETIK